MVTGLTIGRIRLLGSKIEEIEASAKKYEKVSMIYKSLVVWMRAFSSLSSHLGDYL